MLRRPYQIAIPLLLALAGSGPLHAEIHNVQVQGFEFVPNDITIQAGDTVRWTLNPRPGGCEYYCQPVDDPEHTVTADDGSFSSGPPASSFVFEHVFQDPGEYFYHCEVHSEPGRNIDLYMNGRVQVEDGAGGEFQINAGLNDAWYNPATGGQGFFVTVFPDIQRIFLAWFTYDTERPPPDLMAVVGEPGHRWLTAFGPYEGDTAVLDIELTSGGVFDSAEPAPETIPDGDIMLQFSGCNEATVSYDISAPGMQGQVEIQRIATDNVPACEAAAAQ